MEIAWIRDPFAVAVVSGLLGILVTVVAQRLLRKRGLLTYSVRHDRVAVSGDDAVFGSVRVTWNDNPMTNLYTSTVELVNDSLKDYGNVEVRVFSADTILLTERTEIVGTTHFPRWTDEFSQRMVFPSGQQPTPEQIEEVSRRREYLLPTMNRGQVVRFSYLSTARGENAPNIWLDVLHKGVKLKFRVPYNETLGVPQPHAAAVGAAVGLALVAILTVYVRSVALASLVAFSFGLTAQLPGALAIRAWRWARARIGD